MMPRGFSYGKTVRLVVCCAATDEVSEGATMLLGIWGRARVWATGPGANDSLASGRFSIPCTINGDRCRHAQLD